MKPPEIKPTDSDADAEDDLLPFSPDEEATMQEEIDLAMQSYAGLAPKSLLPIMRENLEHALRTHPYPRQLLRAFAKRTPGIVSGEGAIDGSDASDEKAGGKAGA
jgi:hypothetical protein